METQIFGQTNIVDSPPHGPTPFYAVISAELFIGEDAAEAIRTFHPGAEVVVVSSVEEAERLISDRSDVTATLIISPHESLSESPLSALLNERNGALLLLADGAQAFVTACRTHTAELPFTNDTIRLMLDELRNCLPRI